MSARPLTTLVLLALLSVHALATCPSYGGLDLSSARQVCTSWGDPHFTCFNGQKYDDQCYGRRIQFRHAPTCLSILANQTQWDGASWQAAVTNKVWIATDANCGGLFGPCVTAPIETSGSSLIINGAVYAFSSFTAAGSAFTGCNIARGGSSSEVVITFVATNIQCVLTYIASSGGYYNIQVSYPSAVASASDISGLCVAPATCSDNIPPSPQQPGQWNGAITLPQARLACAPLASYSGCYCGPDYEACLLDVESSGSAAAAQAGVKAIALAKTTLGAVCGPLDLTAITSAVTSAVAACSLCLGGCASAVINAQAQLAAHIQCACTASLLAQVQSVVNTALSCGCGA